MKKNLEATIKATLVLLVALVMPAFFSSGPSYEFRVTFSLLAFIIYLLIIAEEDRKGGAE